MYTVYTLNLYHQGASAKKKPLDCGLDNCYYIVIDARVNGIHLGLKLVSKFELVLEPGIVGGFWCIESTKSVQLSGYRIAAIRPISSSLIAE